MIFFWDSYTEEIFAEIFIRIIFSRAVETYFLDWENLKNSNFVFSLACSDSFHSEFKNLSSRIALWHLVSKNLTLRIFRYRYLLNEAKSKISGDIKIGDNVFVAFFALPSFNSTFHGSCSPTLRIPTIWWQFSDVGDTFFIY